MAQLGAGPGRRLAITANPRQVPYLSLLTSVDIQPAVSQDPVADPRGDRWLNGVKYRREPFGSGAVLLQAYDKTTHAEDTNTSLTPDPEGTEVLNDAFTVYAEEKRTTFGFTVNDYIGRAQRHLALTEGYQVEKELWTGTIRQAANAAGAGLALDQWLAQIVTCTTLNGGAALPFGRAYNLLVQAMADASGGEVGMIHGQSGILPVLDTLMIGSPVPAPGTNGQGRPVSRVQDERGNVIVPGLGYPNTSPTGTTPTVGQFWLYGTSIPRIWRDDVRIVPDTYAQALDRVVNNIDFRAERTYLVDWDRSMHFAVLADATVVLGF